MSSTKYIFVTGGVVSGLGKGITAASIGLLLKNNGISVTALKLDPYLNVDPGTMSPFEHGEVFVLGDGSECDLDLGHYERFLETTLDTNSSITSGKIYSAILEKERMGEFLGKNVQLIPNVTNYIKECFEINSDKFDVKIIEIGGSAGDMEGEIFLESLRQFKQKNKKNVIHVHLGYVPFLACSGEYKTKPFQASLKELLRDGIQPDILVARYEPNKEHELSKDQLDKLALFGNVENNCVIPVPDLHSIYAVPNHLNNSPLRGTLSEFVQKPLDKLLPDFFQSEGKVQNPTRIVKVGVVGKYGSKLGDADYSVMQSINIAGFHAGVEVEIIIISAEELEQNNPESKTKLQDSDCIMVLGGFGIRGMEGKITAIKYARENKKPFLGICLGLQMAVVEFARSVCGIDANSAEMFENSPSKGELVIDFMQGQQNIQKKGGTMRLGDYKCDIVEGTLAKSLFGSSSIIERHRHRLEVQTKYLDIMSKNGFKVSGKFNYTTQQGNQEFLPEIMELDKSIHPYFIGIQSHPEMLSRPTKPHPLFLGLINACL